MTEELEIRRIVRAPAEPEINHCKYCGKEVLASADKCRNPECSLWPFYRKLTKLMSQIRRWLPPGVDPKYVPCVYAMMAFNNNGNLDAVERLVEIPFECHIEREMEVQKNG